MAHSSIRYDSFQRKKNAILYRFYCCLDFCQFSSVSLLLGRFNTSPLLHTQFDLVVDVCDSDEEITAVVTERAVSKLRALSAEDDATYTNVTTTTTNYSGGGGGGGGSLGDSGHHNSAGAAVSSSLLDETVQSAHDSSSDIATHLPATSVQATNLLRHTSSDAGGIQLNNDKALQRASSGGANIATDATNNNNDKRQRGRSASRLKATSGDTTTTTTTVAAAAAAGEDSLVVARRRAGKERSGPKDRLLDNSEYIAKQHGSSGSGDEEGDELLEEQRAGRKRTLTRKKTAENNKQLTPSTTSTSTTTTAAATTTTTKGGSGATGESDDDLDHNATTTTTNSRSLKEMLLSQSSEKIAGSLRAGAVIDDDDELAMTLRVSVPQVSRVIAFDVSVDNTAVDVLRVVRERLPNMPPPSSGNAYWLQQTGGAICPMHKSLLELRVMPHELLTLVERPGVDVTVARGAELMRKLNELDRVVQEHNQRELAAEIHAALESSRGPSPPLIISGHSSLAASSGGGGSSPSNHISAATIASIAATQQGTLKRVNEY